MKKTLIISIPLFLAGYAMCVYSFYNRSFYVDCVEDLEHGWDNTGMATVMMAIGAFMLIKKITYSKGFLYKLVKDISLKSYGMYLVHMMFLPFIYAYLSSVLPTPWTIFLSVLITYVVSYLAVKIISFIPNSKYIIG